MFTVMEPGEVATVAASLRGEAMPAPLTTTVYDPITALQDEVDPDNDVLVVATMVRLLQSGRFTVSERHAQEGGRHCVSSAD